MMLCAAFALLLTGCASNADTAPSASPGMNSAGPATTMMPSATDGGMLGEVGDELKDLGNDVGDLLTGRDRPISTAEEALRASQDLRDDVQKLTEVDTAVAVATGSTALVGVTFDASYKGQADDRLMAMVLDRARAVYPGIRAVAVTADQDAVSEIASLYQMLQNGTPYATVRTNADTLAKGMTLYQD